MKIAAVIPARYASSRFPGKPLALIAGKTMVEHVYSQASRAGCFSDIIVATDDERIEKTVKGFGGKAELTSKDIASGTERVWACMAKKKFQAVVNIQGDEPLISEKLLKDVANCLQDKKIFVVSAAYKNSSIDDFFSPHNVKVIVNSENCAQYFSRSPIPYQKKESFTHFFHHIGIYGYHYGALESFIHLAPSELEKIECLEQLRFIEYGITIKMVFSNHPSFGVDIPSDIARIEKVLKRS